MVSSPESHASGREFKSRQNPIFIFLFFCLVKNMRNREGWVDKKEKRKTTHTKTKKTRVFLWVFTQNISICDDNIRWILHFYSSIDDWSNFKVIPASGKKWDLRLCLILRLLSSGVETLHGHQYKSSFKVRNNASLLAKGLTMDPYNYIGLVTCQDRLMLWKWGLWKPAHYSSSVHTIPLHSIFLLYKII